MSALIGAEYRAAHRHGVLVEVYGEGILILVERRWAKRDGGRTCQARPPADSRRCGGAAARIKPLYPGTAPENIRNFIELRGVGFINVARVFGIGAVKMSQAACG